jgi:hypothetical protein
MLVGGRAAVSEAAGGLHIELVENVPQLFLSSVRRNVGNNNAEEEALCAQLRLGLDLLLNEGLQPGLLFPHESFNLGLHL